MILIPAFNEELAIAGVVTGCMKWGLTVVVVDDGSSDDTAQAARQAGAKVITHSDNMGKGAAFNTGFCHARDNGFEAVIALDADGQHDPEEIGSFLEEYEKSGADMIVGTRMSHVESMPWLRRFTNRISSFFVSWISGRRVTDSQSGYRLTGVAAWEKVKPKGTKYDWESEILFAAGEYGLSVSEVPISTIYRDETSDISPVMDTWRFIRVAWKAIIDRRRRKQQT